MAPWTRVMVTAEVRLFVTSKVQYSYLLREGFYVLTSHISLYIYLLKNKANYTNKGREVVTSSALGDVCGGDSGYPSVCDVQGSLTYIVMIRFLCLPVAYMYINGTVYACD